MKAIVKRSAEHLATDAVRAEIVSGRIPLSARLTEMQLSEKLSVSRATVRTALHHLTNEGIVVQTPYSGWAVTSLTSRDAWELYTLRASLEGLAARLASINLKKQGRSDLEAIFKTLRVAVRRRSAAEVAKADFSFHQQIVLLADHHRLAQQYRLVEQQVRMSIASTNALLPDLSSVIEQHRPIMEALLERRPEEAARLSQLHNQSEGEKLVEHLKHLESSAAIVE